MLGVVVLAGGGWWWIKHHGASSQAGAYRTQAIDRGDIRVSISSTGTLSAISTVTVGSQISGLLTAVLVDFNSKVTKGQILARIDPATYEAQIVQGNAQIASAQAQLKQFEATLANATLVYQRNARLGQQQLVAKSDVDQARAAMLQAQAQADSARASIRQQIASTQTTRLNLERTVIRSPVDGVVLTRAVEPGQTVAASLQAPTLFTIAEDLSKMKIQLTVDESDIGQVKQGQNVNFTVDAFPNRQFTGVVSQVQMAATTTNNVVTYPVLVTVDNSDGTLLPGLTVNAEIEVSRQPNVLRVANAALRYKPSDEDPAAQAQGGGASQGGGRGGAGMGDDIAKIASGLQLKPEQQTAFDAAAAEMKKRSAERMQQAQQQSAQQQGGGSKLFGGGMGGPPRSGNGAGNAQQQAQMRARMRDRFQQQFAAFTGTLDATQKAKWDAGLTDLMNARRAPIYLLVDGKAQRTMVRLGATDGSNTEVSGGVKEGDLAITGQQSADSAAQGSKK
ncbi:RND efflux transporter [Lysobacter silvestris]|uniref:RND efflux transporter n=1 Tax=Solilutibacter silvestris TaxID=1645665 RepID=A0A2K1PXI2_9GAMM|nr:RND efflux transporter [Lysobacter silvestris]